MDFDGTDNSPGVSNAPSSPPYSTYALFFSTSVAEAPNKQAISFVKAITCTNSSVRCLRRLKLCHTLVTMMPNRPDLSGGNAAALFVMHDSIIRVSRSSLFAIQDPAPPWLDYPVWIQFLPDDLASEGLGGDKQDCENL